MWAAFEEARTRVVSLRDPHWAGNGIIGDYDLLVHPSDLARALTVITSIAKSAGWRTLFEERIANHHQLVLWHRAEGSGQGPHRINLDLQNALGRKGFYYAPSTPFLVNPVRRNGVAFPSPQAGVIALALHMLLDKGTVGDEYREIVQRDQRNGLEQFAASVLPSEAARKVCAWIRTGAPSGEVRQIASNLRRALIIFHPLNLIRPAFVRLRRWVRFLGRRRGVLVAFLGPDGSGKSTLIQAVKGMSPSDPFPIKDVYMGKRDTFLPTSRLIRMMYRRQEKSSKGGEITSKRRFVGRLLYRLKDIAGLANWTLEQWSRYLIQVRPCLQQGGVVLADRYAYDLACRDERSIAHRPMVLRILAHLFPVPDRTYLLWEQPEVLYARTSEITPTESAAMLERLRQILHPIPNFREVQTHRPTELLASEVCHDIASLMESRYNS
jgi:thymidylate kinase